jgi:hypothetical protein
MLNRRDAEADSPTHMNAGAPAVMQAGRDAAILSAIIAYLDIMAATATERLAVARDVRSGNEQATLGGELSMEVVLLQRRSERHDCCV